METGKEDSENIELFWTLFIASLKKAADDNTVSFNPNGWRTDTAGANMTGIRKVFGEDALSRTKSCEFRTTTITTIRCVEIVFVIISCKTFRVKMESLLTFFCNTYENDGNVNTQGHVCYKD